MAEKQFTTLLATLTQAFLQQAEGLRNISPQGFMFDGACASLDAVYALCGRTDIITKMKGLPVGSSTIWIPLKMQCDYMGSTERDLRTRFRTRLDNYRVTTLEKAFSNVTMKSLSDQIENFAAE